MTDYILQSPSQFPSNSSSITPISNDGFLQQTYHNHEPLISTVDLYSTSREIQEVGGEEREELSVLAVLLTVVRKSLVGCQSEECGVEEKRLMEIGWPTNVRHIAHVTFDRFNGFLGLPVEFEPEVPRRPPSASTRVFGVSTESMQLSYDPRGNCVPTILLMMQRRLYLQGGLQSEGIFRINPENGQEEYVREQLNNGAIPENIDVHCLAGLIKAWLRELPSGILDSLPPEQVMEAQSEDECSRLVSLLPSMEAALLDWAVNLMADVTQFELFNKMNARNIAMVFAPNMTQMSDPLTALMFAVQVMNFLKTLIEKTLREREDCSDESGTKLQIEPTDEDGHRLKPTKTQLQIQPTDEDGHHLKPTNDNEEVSEEDEAEVTEEPRLNQIISSTTSRAESRTGDEAHGFLTPIENILSHGKREKENSPVDRPNYLGTMKDVLEGGNTNSRSLRAKLGQASKLDEAKKGSRKHATRTDVRSHEIAEKKDANVVSRVNLRAERVEAWRRSGLDDTI